MSIKSLYIMPHPPIIVEEVGGAEAGKAQKTIDAVREVGDRVSKEQPELMIVITPHGPVFADALTIHGNEMISGNLEMFNAPEVMLTKKNNRDFVERLMVATKEKGVPLALFDDAFAKDFDLTTKLDHGSIVPLYFVEEKYKNYDLVVINQGVLAPDQLYYFGMILNQVIEETGIRAVVFASGDLSHRASESSPYGFHEAGPKFDNLLIEYLLAKNTTGVINMDIDLCESAGECGKKSIDILLGILDGYDYKVEKLSYEHPFGIGYGVVAFENLEKNDRRQLLEEIRDEKKKVVEKIKSNEDVYVRLAREAIETFVIAGNRIETPQDLTTEMTTERAGVFVSIKNASGLRGCIGTTGGTEKNIAEEIISNAIKAATEDPRFESIEEWELEDLIISVDVLSRSEKVDSIEDLDPKVYGVIVSSGFRGGLLLPDLQGIDTPEEQIRIVLNKAGIRQSDEYDMERFTVKRHK